MNNIFKNKDASSSLVLAFKLLIIFIIGFGRYRICIFLIIYFIITSFFQSKEIYKNIFRIFYVPFILFAAYYDYKFGQLWPIFREINIIYFIAAFIVIDYISTKYFNYLIEMISEGYIFSYCRNCRYENVKLTDKCLRCGKSKSITDNVVRDINKNNIYAESFFNNFYRLSCRLNNKAIDPVNKYSNFI